MPLQIVKSDEVITVKNAIAMLYGQPGIGKTSTAFTADSTLLLDCDSGAHRSAFRKDIVQVGSWKDIANITTEDLEPYKTVAVDTVGRLLDYLSADIIQSNTKMGFNGALTLQGYGQLKTQFAQWAKGLRSQGKDLIFIAHDKEDKRGDELAVRPDIQGGSYGEVFKIADAVGYMYRGDKTNILDFNPTTVWEGKNVAHLEPIAIPDFNAEPDFFAGVLTKIKDSMNQMSEEGRAIAKMVEKIKANSDKAETPEDLNKILDDMNTLPDVAVRSAKRIIWNRCRNLGLNYDSEKSCFVAGNADDQAQSESA